MKLEYKILWIEDNPKSIRRDKRQVAEYIEGLGFVCEVQEINNFSDFEKNIGCQNTSEYDLLLIDLDLGNQETKDEGNTIITKIRDEKVYTEIVFYSSQYEELNRKLNEHFVEGIFTSSRDELKDKVKKIIDITIKKTQDVNNLRGLIMAEVAELDRIKEQIIKKYNSQADSDFKKYIKEKVFSKIKEELKNLNCLVKVEDSECTYDEINLEELQKNFFYDTFKKSRTVFKIKKQKCNTIEFIHENYKKEIIDKRNVFAHQEEEPREDGINILKYPNGEDLEFTAEHCIQIRKDIRKYKKLLVDIKNQI
ncbi:hypothetical protein [Sulfurimonas paralvinellae]|uniref:Response regulator n=1 Tax=Sulfurimonas paralvinellae TaxID=317658 RepID=A0A7M1B8W3_9BACT|nr:hypothetical protein [Sulfurimonas paralvinellae]QOP45866.1 hypothetical protein FM071_06010 [Sulfurimonas paralvinellae]